MREKTICTAGNKSLLIASAVISFVAAAGYIIRAVSVFTNVVIAVHYDEAVVYGVLPAVFVLLYGIAVLLQNKLKPLFTAVPVAAMTLYLCVITIFNNFSSDNMTNATLGGAAASSAFTIVLSATAPILYILTVAGVIRKPTAAKVLLSVSCVIYLFMVGVTIYMYAEHNKTIDTFYGYIGATAGMTLYMISVLVNTCSFRTESK